MGFVARQGALAFTVDDDVGDAVGGVVVQREDEFVVIVERETHRVETGAEIGAGGGHAHTHAVRYWRHQSSTRRMEGVPVTKSSDCTASTVARNVSSSVRCVTRRSCWISPS